MNNVGSTSAPCNFYYVCQKNTIFAKRNLLLSVLFSSVARELKLNIFLSKIYVDCEKNWKEQVKNARDVTAIQKAICIFTVSQAEDLGGRLIGQVSLF